jgi:hypothetical protein
VALVALGVGCGTSERSISAVESTITESSASADERVVALLLADGALLCSGVIVAPHVVLTAAHCGSAATLRTVSLRGTTVRAVVVHPAYDASSQNNDLAALIVESALSPSATLGALGAVGSELSIVGFGATASDGGTAGARREGRAKVASVSATEFVVSPGPSLTCAGDSGGAAFADGGALVGITSRGDAACVERSVFTRIDAARAFIDAVIAANADGAAKSGDRCHSDAHCAVGRCIAARDEPAIHYCSPPCGTCPAPLVCNAGNCEHPQPTPGALGSPCKDDCVAGECRAVLGRGPICTRRCLPDVGCGAGLACENETGATYWCVPARAPTKEADDGACAIGHAASSRCSLAMIALAALTMLLRRGARRG